VYYVPRNGSKFVEIEHEFSRQLETIIGAALAVVVALIWKDAIGSVLARYAADIQYTLNLSEVWMVQVFYALVATFISVAVIVALRRILHKRK
jgi:hypothetical protein